jgi:hypothetical protein
MRGRTTSPAHYFNAADLSDGLIASERDKTVAARLEAGRDDVAARRLAR